uniref:Neur_chan_LBD domain-containing protein n=1 Tax=Ascaris lumbricoides TaxID=6252 RepID=A0A0M3HZM8_ASCLU
MFAESEEPISVAVGLRLQRMNLVSDTNSLHVDAFLTREWSDSRLKFEQSDPCRQAINGAKLKVRIMIACEECFEKSELQLELEETMDFGTETLLHFQGAHCHC